jgi:hypothetical protein
VNESQYPDLQTELERAVYSGKSDAECATILNDAEGTEAGDIAVTTLTKGEFLLKILPVTLTLPSATAAIQAKWDRILAFVRSADLIHVGDSGVQTLIEEAVSDGIMTQDLADSIPTRKVARGEVLGFGEVNTWDIARAKAL